MRSSQWTANDRSDLVDFLVAYREAAVGRYQLTKPEQFVIGGIDFPILSHRSIRQRFLALPIQLTAKQRKVVHECCVESKSFRPFVGKHHDSPYLQINDQPFCFTEPSIEKTDSDKF
jgi:hypothetical protein